RWFFCSGGGFMFWGDRDGIYRSQGGEAESLTDQDLYLLFPHSGVAGTAVDLGSVVFTPPDFSQTSALRLSYADQHLFFDYIDTNGAKQTLVYSLVSGFWSLDSYVVPARIHYGEEGPSVHSILLGGDDGNIWQLSGATDGGTAFTSEL